MADDFDQDNDDMPPSDRSYLIYGAAFLIGVGILMGIGWYFR
jgi:hypothetical protein